MKKIALVIGILFISIGGALSASQKCEKHADCRDVKIDGKGTICLKKICCVPGRCGK